MILSTNNGGQVNLVLLGHGPYNAFLVPNSCRATERAEVTDNTFEND